MNKKNNLIIHVKNCNKNVKKVKFYILIIFYLYIEYTNKEYFMSVSFNSNVAAGQTGSLGKEYDIQYSRYKKNQAVFGEASFYGNLVTMGLNEEKVLNKFGNDMGYKDGSLSWGRSVSSNRDANNVLFRAADGSFADVDFDRNNYTITTERDIAKSCGVWSDEGGKAYDIMTVDRGGLNFYEFTASGLGDGIQNTTGVERVLNYSNKWGLFSYLVQEVDYNYLLNDYYTEEGLKGQWIRQMLQNNVNQFMNSNEINYLSTLNEANGRLGLASYAYSRLFV